MPFFFTLATCSSCVPIGGGKTGCVRLGAEADELFNLRVTTPSAMVNTKRLNFYAKQFEEMVAK